jgi:hypothetical protein
MYIHLYTCTFVHMYICTHEHLYTCTFVHMYICTHVHLYTCTFVHMYICTHVHLYTCRYICTHVHLFVHMYIASFFRKKIGECKFKRNNKVGSYKQDDRAQRSILLVFFVLFYLKTTTLYPGGIRSHDSFLAPISSVAGGDVTTRPRRHPGQYFACLGIDFCSDFLKVRKGPS